MWAIIVSACLPFIIFLFVLSEGLVEYINTKKAHKNNDNIYDLFMSSLFRIVITHRSQNKHIIKVYVVINGNQWFLVKKFVQKGNVDVSKIHVSNKVGCIDTSLIPKEINSSKWIKTSERTEENDSP